MKGHHYYMFMGLNVHLEKTIQTYLVFTFHEINNGIMECPKQLMEANDLLRLFL